VTTPGADEQPLAQATIRLPELRLQAETDSLGRFSVRGRAASGCYWLLARRLGYYASFSEVMIGDTGASMVAVLPLRPSTAPFDAYTHVQGPCTRGDRPWPE